MAARTDPSETAGVQYYTFPISHQAPLTTANTPRPTNHGNQYARSPKIAMFIPKKPPATPSANNDGSARRHTEAELEELREVIGHTKAELEP